MLKSTSWKAAGTDLIRRLARHTRDLEFGEPVSHVYRPLDYARKPHLRYFSEFGRPPKKCLLIGMNPGPWGMAQTGVPFGEVAAVRDWLRIDEPIESPADQHPARPIHGSSCVRNEVSGARLWGWARDRFSTPSRFFKDFFVGNYCPLCFMESSGRNRTPDRLPRSESDPLFEACDDALRRLVELMRPKYVIGIGVFAQRRIRSALGDADVVIGRILHPSPASPAANRGWEGTVTRELRDIGLEIPGD